MNISGEARGLTFDPNPVPSNGTSTATEPLDGPVADEQITETVTVDVGFSLGNGGTTELASTITVGACTGPAAPPDIAFSFANDASVEVAEVGDTIDYTYCGENSSDVDLEVVRVVDDKFGVLEVPDEQTVVEPGQSLCSTDLGLPVSYVATEADAGSTILDNATVTVRTVGDDPQTFQATDPAEVEILGFQSPEQVAAVHDGGVATHDGVAANRTRRHRSERSPRQADCRDARARQRLAAYPDRTAAQRQLTSIWACGRLGFRTASRSDWRLDRSVARLTSAIQRLRRHARQASLCFAEPPLQHHAAAELAPERADRVADREGMATQPVAIGAGRLARLPESTADSNRRWTTTSAAVEPATARG